MRPSLEETRSRLRALLPRLRDRYGVSGLALFGSQVRGEATAASDLDVLVDFVTTPNLFDLVDLGEELTA